jgi:8-oxo-dGTP diphosphatase
VSVRCRFMEPGEEGAVCDLVARTFGEFVAPDYSTEGVQEFLEYVQPDALLQRSLGTHFTLLAVMQDQIVGMIEVRDDDHISLFFVDRGHLRRGIGRELLHKAAQICRRRRPTAAEMSVNSSLYAVPVYERLGFRQTGPDQVKNGIHFVPMALGLAHYWYIVNVEGAVVRDGRYLMVVRGEQESHAPGVLSLPGGKVENADGTENVLEGTLRREIEEEVGIQIWPDMAYVESKAFVADDGEPVIDVVFVCRYKSGRAVAADPGEVAAIRWMTARQVLEHPKAPPWTRQSVELAEKRRVAKGW